MEDLVREGADMRRMKNSTGKLEYSRMGQDVLNATFMAIETPLVRSLATFPWVGEILPHTIWHHKPWNRNYYALGASHLAERVERIGSLQTTRLARLVTSLFFEADSINHRATDRPSVHEKPL